MWVWLVCGYLLGVVTIGILYLREMKMVHKYAGQEVGEANRRADETWLRHIESLTKAHLDGKEAWKQSLSVTQQIRAQAGRQMEQELATITSAINSAARSVAYPRPPYVPNPDLMAQADLSHDTSQDVERIPAWLSWESDSDEPVEVMTE